MPDHIEVQLGTGDMRVEVYYYIDHHFYLIMEMMKHVIWSVSRSFRALNDN